MFAALAPVAPVASRMLQLAQQPAERIDLMFVGKLLPLGKFDQLQSLFHLLHRLFQGFDDFHHFIDGLADGGTIRPGGGRNGNSGLKFVPRRRGLCRGFGRTDGGHDRRSQWFSLRRLSGDGAGGRGAPPSTTAAMTAPPSAARFPGACGAICLG